jgi:glycosyltransferase involved in cell wall biosynthesis
MATSKKINKKIIFFTNADWHFYNHLLPLALEAKKRGTDVIVLTSIQNHQNEIERKGLTIIPIKMSRGGLNPFIELTTFIKLFFILFREKPDILLNFTLKPILYGTIISLFAGIPKVTNTFLGMGYLFISENPFIKVLRGLYCGLLSVVGLIKKPLYIVQNKDDQVLLQSMNISNVKTQCCVGIKLENFPQLPEPKGKIVFALVSRMLKDKGVLEFIEAAKLLKDLDAEFWLVGKPDEENKASLNENFLQNQKYIKYLGHKDNIEKIWKKAHIAVLPSYREGLSRSLLEAGAYGRAIITTDAPGGRELVENKKDGLLVPIKASASLAEAMKLLYKDKTLRQKLSGNMRKKIVENYDADYIAKLVVDLYGV